MAMPLLGILVFLAIAWTISENRKKISLKFIAVSLLVQLLIMWLVLNGPLSPLFELFNAGFLFLISHTQTGSEFLFGKLANSKDMGFFFAFQVLPTIIFFSAFSNLLFHYHILQPVIWLLSRFFSRSLGTSGPETLATAANIFLGQTEAPLLVRPYLAKMTKSEVFTIMVAGQATIAGGVMAFIVQLLGDQVESLPAHLLAASLMSAPAALLFSKLIVPQKETLESQGQVPKTLEPTPDSTTSETVWVNGLDAVSQGAQSGLQLALAIGAILLVFMSLISFLDASLAHISGSALGKTLTFADVLSYVFAPVALLLGIPVAECLFAGRLLGEKILLTEAVAFSHLAQSPDGLSDSTKLVLTYALSGFANFASIGIQIAGIGGLCPNLRPILVRYGFKAMVAGTLATLVTACLVSAFYRYPIQ